MEERSSSEHLSSSLTDLMTSLMVIFILLLLVFISHTASKDAALRDVLLNELKKDLIPQGFNESSIRPDPKDRNAILVIVPNNLMRFESREAFLPAEGKVFLQTHIPQFADVLCGNEFSASIDSIVVEGHTDRQPWQGSSPEESENKNLKLSQDRSMAVVEEALADLKGHNTRPCFLEKLSATPR
jgi:flagellar motor protein MotB